MADAGKAAAPGAVEFPAAGAVTAPATPSLAPPTPDGSLRRSGRKTTAPPPFLPSYVEEHVEETKPARAPAGRGGARVSSSKRTAATPSGAATVDSSMPFSVMDFISPPADAPTGLATMPAILPWNGTRGRRFFLDYPDSEAG